MLWRLMGLLITGFVSVLSYDPSKARCWPDVPLTSFLATNSSTSGQPTSYSPSLQSPIDIRYRKTVERCMSDLRFQSLLSPNVLLDMVNTGYTVRFEIDSASRSRPTMAGGPLRNMGVFAFEDLHIHWGYREVSGGEHSIDGHRYKIEGHCVHYNVKYGSFEEAAKRDDGLAVIAFFLDIGYEDNHSIEDLVRLLPRIHTKDSRIKVRAIQVLEWFVRVGRTNDYYTYPGSLTTPPYTENVVWIVYPEPLFVSRRQVEAFQNLLSPNISNSRQLQKFNNRPLLWAKRC